MAKFLGPHRYFKLACKVLILKGFARIRNTAFFNVAVVWMFGAGSCLEERKRMQANCEKVDMQMQAESDHATVRMVALATMTTCLPLFQKREILNGLILMNILPKLS